MCRNRASRKAQPPPPAPPPPPPSRMSCLDGSPPKKLPGDYVLLDSTRSKMTTRAAHRSILQAESTYFTEALAELSSSRKLRCGYTPNTLQLDVSAEAIDIVLDHVYNKMPAEIRAGLVIETYAAARRLGIASLEEDLVDIFQKNVHKYLADSSLLNSSVRAVDVASLVDLLDMLRLDDEMKLRLRKQLDRWNATTSESSSVAWNVCEKLLPTHKSARASQRPLESQVAIAGYFKDGRRGCRGRSSQHVMVPISSTATDLRTSQEGREPNRHSVIFNGKLYIPVVNAIYVCPPGSSIPYAYASFNTDAITCMEVFEGEVFFSTRDTIYVLDPQGLGCTKVAEVAVDILTSFAVLQRDADGLTIAIPIAGVSQVHTFMFGSGSTAVVGTAEVRTFPHDLTLIGSHAGLLYFGPTRRPRPRLFYYEVFGGSGLVKRHFVEACHQVEECRIHNAILYIAYYSPGRNQTQPDSIVAVDLNLDMIVFRRSCSELSLEWITSLIPIVDGDCDRRE